MGLFHQKVHLSPTLVDHIKMSTMMRASSVRAESRSVASGRVASARPMVGKAVSIRQSAFVAGEISVSASVFQPRGARVCARAGAVEVKAEEIVSAIRRLVFHGFMFVVSNNNACMMFCSFEMVDGDRYRFFNREIPCMLGLVLPPCRATS